MYRHPFTTGSAHQTEMKAFISELSYRVDNLQSQTRQMGPSYYISLFFFKGILPLLFF